jgi:hypothetical protein
MKARSVLRSRSGCSQCVPAGQKCSADRRVRVRQQRGGSCLPESVVDTTTGRTRTAPWDSLPALCCAHHRRAGGELDGGSEWTGERVADKLMCSVQT